MIKKESGHIVTMASMAGLSAVNNLVDYSSSKHAAIGFDDALRSELTASLHKIVNQSHYTSSVKSQSNTGQRSQLHKDYSHLPSFCQNSDGHRCSIIVELDILKSKQVSNNV